MDVKKCGKCEDTKPISEFRLRRKPGSKVSFIPYSHCRECERMADRARDPKARSEARRRQVYGMEAGEYDRMHAAQKGACAICGYEHKSLHIDHDHKTGKVRALLCNWCNTAIGYAREDVDVLKKIIKYINKHKGSK